MNSSTDNKKYKSHKIPGQRTLFDDAGFQDEPSIEPSDSISFNNGGFVEIEIDQDKVATNSIPIPQSVPTVTDPKRLVFNEMRQIARDNYIPVSMQSKFYSKHVQHNNSVTFYKQAVFMKDFEDDFTGIAPFSSYFPFYQSMGYEQLRTYFTWRTKVRKGEIEGTSLSYAFVYIYELLNNIGVDNPEDGLDKLMAFWKAYKQYDDKLDKYVLKWIKDYHIYYDLPKSFKTFIYENDIYMHYPKVIHYEAGRESNSDNFELFASVSKYDIRQSAFYKSYENNDSNFIPDCFNYVLEKIKNAVNQTSLNFDELVFYTTKKFSVWSPFEGALFYPWFYSKDRTVVLSDQEIYICTQNKWSFSSTIVMENGKQLIGYIMKQMESELRQVTHYQYKLTAGISMIKGTVIPRLNALDISLEKIINDAVSEFYKEKTKIVVSVDKIALSQIREEAIATQEKLIVPEDEVTVAKEEVVAAVTAVAAQAKEEAVITPPLSPVSQTDEWAELQNSLSEVELKALSVILEEGNIKQFADEQNIMLEVLADGINEKAVDYIGDNLLELDLTIIIYDEYLENVMEMVKNNGN